MKHFVSQMIVLTALASAAMFAMTGCGPKTQSETAQPTSTPIAEGQVAYTVPAGELDNPDNSPIYVCPMEEHKEQVSLDPEARCKLCNMKLMPLEDAEKGWGGEPDHDHSGSSD